jgi:hypothetical protein
MSQYASIVIAASGLIVALIGLAISQRYHCKQDDEKRGEQNQRIEDHEKRLLWLEHTRNGGR